MSRSAQLLKLEALSKAKLNAKPSRGSRDASPVFHCCDEAPTLRSWQGWRTILIVTLMRVACGFAIALWLSLPAAGVARQQDQAASPNSSGQAPTVPTPAETVPAAPDNPQTPAAGQKTSDSAGEKKTDAGSTRGAISGTASGVRKHRKRIAPAQDNAPRKILVREGGAREPAAQIAPDITPAEATRERQNAERLLGAADGHLKQLTGRPLNAQQQETVGQIRNYMQGARSALKEGDVRRAGTLAEKAHLLADDLVKH
jgi:hypothetical protein